MIFDPIETITLIFSFVAFVFVVFEVKQHTSDSGTSKRFWRSFLLVAGLIFSNRLFTNLEVLFYGDIFNMLEHVAMACAACVFLYSVWIMRKSKWKLPA